MADDADLLRRFGQRCRALRREKGLSQLDMVRYHGFSLSHYQKIERGVLNAQLVTLAKLAASFQVSLSDLFMGV